jgi:hypothetical protein
MKISTKNKAEHRTIIRQQNTNEEIREKKSRRKIKRGRILEKGTAIRFASFGICIPV